jgi:hypothetical protein
LKLTNVVGQGRYERTVGAALRGRPRFKTYSPNLRLSILEFRVLNRGAATEGRPYSTFVMTPSSISARRLTLCGVRASSRVVSV